MEKSTEKNGVFLKAYRGDAMTLLAFNLKKELVTSNFVGFTILFKTPSGKKFPIYNLLNFDGKQGYRSSEEAPFQKFRWIHVPGTLNQKLNATEYGDYTYYVTPRYWNSQSKKLEPIQDNLTAQVKIEVGKFTDKNIELGFTRGFMTSQAYVNRFGNDQTIYPSNGDWMFNTNASSGKDPNGKSFTYEDQYKWIGFTAREKIIGMLNEVVADSGQSIDLFAYDFNEPLVAKLCLKLAELGRIRVILDDSKEHKVDGAEENDFEERFNKVKTSKADLIRGHFSRFSHDKVFIIKKNGKAKKVITGSTNFSVTGFCVNANHIIVINEPKVAELYKEVFEASWGKENMKSFKKSKYAKKPLSVTVGGIDKMTISFSPHDEETSGKILDSISSSISKAKSSVLFSIMALGETTGGSVYPALREVQNNTKIFSYGVTDQTKAVSLYKPGSNRGILVNSKSLVKELPEPFKTEVKDILANPTNTKGISPHRIHHKFVVVDFNTDKAVVYCGSSNLALGGEMNNGDNLLAIYDKDIATVFAIEAIRLIDHYQFRASKIKSKDSGKAMKLTTNSDWADPYYNKKDIKYTDRDLFCKI